MSCRNDDGGDRASDSFAVKDLIRLLFNEAVTVSEGRVEHRTALAMTEMFAMDYPNTAVCKAQERERLHRREIETEDDRGKHKHSEMKGDQVGHEGRREGGRKLSEGGWWMEMQRMGNGKHKTEERKRARVVSGGVMKGKNESREKGIHAGRVS